ncbi:MAG: CHRD domain-containing protein [Blastocatellia bacterium]
MRKLSLSLFMALAPLVLLSLTALAETYTAVVPLSPASEIPPITGLNASGTTTLTINVVRDAAGAILTGSVTFQTSFTFPGNVTVTGHHIHQGASTVNAPVVINTGLGNTVFATGAGATNHTVTGVSVTNLTNLLNNPAGFYVNLHTSDNTGGAIRGQIGTLVESVATTVTMSPANEVPPITDLNASAIATLTVYPRRSGAAGTITGGSVNFAVNYNFPGTVTIRGLHIHNGPAGANAGVVIDTGLSGANTIVSATGTGMINLTAPTVSAAVMQALLANPAGHYVNLHTSVNTGGAVRSQLGSLAAPPAIAMSTPVVLPTGAVTPLTLSGAKLANVAAVFINGAPVSAIIDGNTPNQVRNVGVPSALTASAGVLSIQVQDIFGVMSAPFSVPVVAAANVNAQAAVTVDAARFGAAVAPDSIASIFGTNLATAPVSATTLPLPTALDGTSVYVNGAPAQLFFVSAGQINFHVPPGTALGQASLVVVQKNGIVSQGTINVTASTASVFTKRSDGTGAPIGIASTNGSLYNIALFNNDGTAFQVDPGTTGLFVSLFVTGLRFAPNSDNNAANGVAESVTVTIGGAALPATYAGAQGGFLGLDQINFFIPANFGPRGPLNMVITVDGKTSNSVQVNLAGAINT